jgi:hypothetical protein
MRGRWRQLELMKFLILILLVGFSFQCNTEKTQDLLGSWKEVYPKYPNATNYDSLVFVSPDSLKRYTVSNTYVSDTSLETFTLTDGYLISKWTTGLESVSIKHRIVKLTTDSLLIERLGNHSLIRYKRVR